MHDPVRSEHQAWSTIGCFSRPHGLEVDQKLCGPLISRGLELDGGVEMTFGQDLLCQGAEPERRREYRHWGLR